MSRKGVVSTMKLKIVTISLSVLLFLSHGSKARPWLPSRGGASSNIISNKDPYHQLALALRSRFDDPPDVASLEKALKSLSSAQTALKGLDGVAYEAYQRTHSDGGSSKDLTSVSGRARRSATRMAATADAFLAAELCEMMESDSPLESFQNENATLAHREILLSDQHVKLTNEVNVSMIVLWEPSYDGGAGIDHGGIQDLARRTGTKRGRILVVLKDPLNTDLKGTIDILDVEHFELEVNSGLVANEIASVHPYLYRTAGRVLRSLEPTLTGDRFRNQTEVAVHFVGQSLAGGVASLAAVLLDGTLSMPKDKTRKKNTDKRVVNGTQDEIGGFGHGRTSAVVLGAPPCLSGNVKAPYVKSVIFGDDVVCRITPEGIERLCQRSDRVLKGGILGGHVGWMSDVVSLTVNSLKRHAHGSEGEERKLALPGYAFLVRPRKLGGVCSMHEVGGLKGGREALRAAVLWQLHDILLSSSLWKHHRLKDYIEGLHKVQLRGAEVDERM